MSRSRRPSAHAGSHASAMLTAAVLAVIAAPATSQRQFAELGTRGLPADADQTAATVLGDVDGDGDLDLVVGNSGQQSRLYLNDGVGNYTDATTARMPAVSDNTTSLALGDVDGDGDLDLVLGNYGRGRYGGGQNRLYLNDGTGTFTDATAARMPAVGDPTSSVAFGDLDRDGDLDLIVGNRGQSLLYLNNGAGRFVDATAVRLPAASVATTSVVLGDVDQDGDLDLVLGNTGSGPWYYTAQSLLYLNDGAGRFVDATTTQMPNQALSTISMAAGDVDQDGDLDLILGNGSYYGQTALYLNNGAGTFVDATATQMPAGGDSANATGVVDVDGDGDLDLVLGWWGQSRLYLNDGSGTFSDVTASHLPAETLYTAALALGDVDGDGDVDLVLGNSSQQNKLYRNGSAGTFREVGGSRIPKVQTFASALAAGDFDGDGDVDLIVGNRVFRGGQGQSLLYLNDGGGRLADGTAGRLPSGSYNTTALATCDLDSDGDLDLIVGNFRERSRLYLNDGAGTFTDQTATMMPTGNFATTSLACGDLDGDGHVDLIVGNDLQANRLYLNNGLGRLLEWTSGRLPPLSERAMALALGDVDADGDLDLLVGNDGQSRLFLNDGTATFTDASALQLPAGSYDTRAIALGDVDRDGDLDLILGNAAQQNLLYLNDGTGTFTDQTAARMPVGADATSSLVLGDVDEDGDLDLMVGNDGQSLLYVNDGTGTFSDATAARMRIASETTSAVVLGDLDSDGDLDLVLGNVGQSVLAPNLLRQLDAPDVPHIGRNFRLDVYSRYGPASPGETAFTFLSSGTARIEVLPFGILGIDLNLAIVLPPVAIPQPSGVGSLTIPVPNQPGLVGGAIHMQTLVVQQGVQARLTNVVDEIIN